MSLNYNDHQVDLAQQLRLSYLACNSPAAATESALSSVDFTTLLNYNGPHAALARGAARGPTPAQFA